MKKQKRKDDNLNRYFLTDAALDSSINDEFGHNDYAEILEKIIREQPTPFNIGIFGKWGVGKSTIVNLLKERLKKDISQNRIKFLEIKVWKYDKNSLRRKFISGIAQGLGLPINDIWHDMYSSKEIVHGLIDIKEIWAMLFNRRSVPMWGIVIFFPIWILLKIINLIGVQNLKVANMLSKFEDIIILVILGAIATWLIELLRKAKVKFKTSKFDSEEQFESSFIDLVKQDKSTKIIFIDDLDRCSKEKVIKTIETIKTFLDVETCIFIIACDDDIIKNAINRTYELFNQSGKDEGSEYLEKFFQYTLRVPPFMIPDMKKFIMNLLNKSNNSLLKLKKEVLEDIIFITINRNIKSPRNAIAAMNEFVTLFLLAQSREQDSSSKLHKQNITNNLQVLAIVSSLRLNFPEFYSALLNNSDLIFWIKDIIEGKINELNEKEISICSKYYQKREVLDKIIDEEKEDESDQNTALQEFDWEQPKNNYIDLIHFIESTKDHLTISDITPFLLMGVDSTSYLIGDVLLQECNDALKNGIESKITKLIDDADESRKENLFEHITFWIEYKLEGVERRKALQILSKQIYKCPESKIYRAARAFNNNFFNKNIQYEEYKKYVPSGIFTCARVLGGIYRKDLISQATNFIGNGDNEYDKLILREIFNNENIIMDQNSIKKISSYLDNRVINPEDPKIKSCLDFDYIKGQIKEYSANPNVLEKFFSNNIIEEIIDHLIEIDSLDEVENEKYEEIVSIFELVKKIILDKNISRLCKYYQKLITTRVYYSQILQDINIQQANIPEGEIKELSTSLLTELESYEDDLSIKQTLDPCVYWFSKYPNTIDEELTENLSNQLANLINSDNELIFFLTLTYFDEFYKYLTKDQANKVLEAYIGQIDPSIQLNKSQRVESIIIDKKDILNSTNRLAILSKLIYDLNSIDGLSNDPILHFWESFFNQLIDLFGPEELDILIKPYNPQFILHPGFPSGNNVLRTIYCEFISKVFDKISPAKQNEYFESFIPYLSSNDVEGSEYASLNLYDVCGFLTNSPFLNKNFLLLINQLSIASSQETKFRYIKILLTTRNILSAPQLENILEVFASVANCDPDESLKLLLSIWKEIPENSRYKILKSLIQTILSTNQNSIEAILKVIELDIDNLDNEGIVNYISLRENELKENELERDFYAKIAKKISTKFSSTLINLLKLTKISEIKSESDIDLCRNKMSTIISIKGIDYEKDREVNDMFFSLLNDNVVPKKQLAIDVFDHYYDSKHPFQRKGALEERFNSLLEELDNNYKKKIYHLTDKYQLNVKKSFWNYLFGG